MNNPRRIEHQNTEKGTVPVYATSVVEQPWALYSTEEHLIWQQLCERQQQLLTSRACEEFLQAQQKMGLYSQTIPKFDELNAILVATTGWRLVGVEGLLPELNFFEHLAKREFPVTWWIRDKQKMDYISEPDLFHDLFGHVPLLMNPMFADYMQAYGQGGVKAFHIGSDALAYLTRLYWYTVEFGLIQTSQGLRIYGAGIVSSKGESIYALESAIPNRIGFDLKRIMQTRYRIDTYQKSYFVIEDYQQLMEATAVDFAPIYQQLNQQSAIPAGQIIETDKVFQHGTGEGWDEHGDI